MGFPGRLFLAANLATAQPVAQPPDLESDSPLPLNDIVERRVIHEKRTLDYPPKHPFRPLKVRGKF